MSKLFDVCSTTELTANPDPYLYLLDGAQAEPIAWLRPRDGAQKYLVRKNELLEIQ